MYFVSYKLCFCVSFCLPHHSVALPTAKHLILLPLWDQVIGGLLGFLLLFSCFSFSSLHLFLRFFLRSLFLLLQLELKVLQVALGPLVLWV